MALADDLDAVARVDPTLADRLRAEFAAKRGRDSLADAESYLRELADPTGGRLERALAVVLTEYDARVGRVVRQPDRIAVAPPPRTVTRPPAAPTPPPVDAKGDVVLP